MVTTVSVAGATGSIGTQTLDVIGADPEGFEVVALGAGSSVGVLAEQARRWSPKVVAIADASLAGELQAAVPAGTEVVAGPDRSEEHTSELQSLMRISYAVFCLKKKNK